jgi:hypothetical protein
VVAPTKVSDRECERCAEGTFKAAAGNAAGCTACPNGQYQTEKGASGCNTCNFWCHSGKTHAGCGLASAGACVDCGVGTFKRLAGVMSCSNCPQGQYQAGSGFGYCHWCNGQGYIPTLVSHGMAVDVTSPDLIPLEHCHGDCDTDAHCKAGYKCHQQDMHSPVPGCAGVPDEAMDYCVRDGAQDQNEQIGRRGPEAVQVLQLPLRGRLREDGLRPHIRGDVHRVRSGPVQERRRHCALRPVRGGHVPEHAWHGCVQGVRPRQVRWRPGRRGVLGVLDLRRRLPPHWLQRQEPRPMHRVRVRQVQDGPPQLGHHVQGLRVR